MPRRPAVTKEPEAHTSVDDLLSFAELPTRSSKRKLEELLQSQVQEEVEKPEAKKARGRPKVSRDEKQSDTVNASTTLATTQPETISPEVIEKVSPVRRGRKKKEVEIPVMSEDETEEPDVSSKSPNGNSNTDTIATTTKEEKDIPQISVGNPTEKRIKKKQRVDSDDEDDLPPVSTTTSIDPSTSLVPPTLPLHSYGSHSSISFRNTSGGIASSNEQHLSSSAKSEIGKVDHTKTKANNTFSKEGYVSSSKSNSNFTALSLKSIPKSMNDSKSNPAASSAVPSSSSSTTEQTVSTTIKEDSANEIMDVDKIEDAKLPPRNIWIAELEAKIDSCKVIRYFPQIYVRFIPVIFICNGANIGSSRRKIHAISKY